VRGMAWQLSRRCALASEASGMSGRCRSESGVPSPARMLSLQHINRLAELTSSFEVTYNVPEYKIQPRSGAEITENVTGWARHK